MDEQNFNNNNFGNGSFGNIGNSGENPTDNSTHSEYGADTWHESRPSYEPKTEYGYTWQEQVRPTEPARDTVSVTKPAKVKKEKNKSRFFPKLCAAMAFGLAFGACAAGSFYAINTYVIKEEPKAIETGTDVEELQKSVAELQSALASSKDKNSTVITTAAVSVLSMPPPPAA